MAAYRLPWHCCIIPSIRISIARTSTRRRQAAHSSCQGTHLRVEGRANDAEVYAPVDSMPLAEGTHKKGWVFHVPQAARQQVQKGVWGMHVAGLVLSPRAIARARQRRAPMRASHAPSTYNKYDTMRVGAEKLRVH